MKRIVSLLLIAAFLFSVSPIQIQAVYERFPDEMEEIYYIEDYYDTVWDNYNFYLDQSIWPYASDRSNHVYTSFVDKVNTDWVLRLAIDFAAGLTGETVSKDKNMEILINLMALMDYELNDAMNHQVEADTLKTFKDYAMDVTGILVDTVTLQAKAGSLLDKFADLTDITHKFMDITMDGYEDYKQLDKILQNYELYHGFLTSIITYSDDKNLVDAAETIKANVEKALILKLDYFAKETLDYSVFIGNDVFFDKVLMEPSNWSKADQSFITNVSAVYGKVEKGFAAGGVIAGLGVFAGDMLVGISDMLNRVTEMRILSLVFDAIVKDMDNNKRQASRDNFNAIDRAYNNMLYLMYVNARGEYCLYNLLQYDSQILSLLFNDRLETEEWFQAVQSIHKGQSELLVGIEFEGALENGFYPNIENYRKEDDASIYYQYIRDQLIPKYGLSTLERIEGKMHTWEDEWLSFTGILSAYISDLNQDNNRELFLLYLQETPLPYTSSTSYVLFADIYSMSNGVPTLLDTISIGPYSEADDLGHGYGVVSLRTNQWTEESLFVSSVLVNDNRYIVIENTSLASSFADGSSCHYWALKLENGKMNIAFSFTQTDGGSSGFQYTGYELKDGNVLSKELLYSEWYEEKGTYDDFNYALKAFFDRFGVATNYKDRKSSILNDSVVEQRILSWSVKCTDQNWKSSIYTYIFDVMDFTDLRSYYE